MWQWKDKAWKDMVKKVIYVMDTVAGTMRSERLLGQLERRMPKLISLARAVTDLEDRGGSIVYTISSDSTVYLNPPTECRHEKEHLYKHGNQNGKFMECRACGAGWRATEWTNPISKEQAFVYDVPLQPRPKPGAARPKEYSKSSSQSYQPSAQRSRRATSTPIATNPRVRPTVAPSTSTRSARSALRETGYVHIGTDDEMALDDPPTDRTS